MNLFKIEAGTAQHIGNRPRQNDRAAVLTGARAPGYVLALLSDGLNGPAGAEQVLHTAKQVFDGFKPGDGAESRTPGPAAARYRGRKPTSSSR